MVKAVCGAGISPTFLKMPVHSRGKWGYIPVRSDMAISAIWKPSCEAAGAIWGHSQPDWPAAINPSTRRRDNHSMDPAVIKYLCNHQVILCLLCDKHHCIPPKDVRDHLYEFHRDKLSKKQRMEIIKFAASLELAQPRLVQIPNREDGPVPLLHKEEGYECLTYGYVCLKDSTMDKHGRNMHQWNIIQRDKWKRQWIQVFDSPSIKADISQDILLIKSIHQIFPCRHA